MKRLFQNDGTRIRKFLLLRKAKGGAAVRDIQSWFRGKYFLLKSNRPFQLLDRHPDLSNPLDFHVSITSITCIIKVYRFT